MESKEKRTPDSYASLSEYIRYWMSEKNLTFKAVVKNSRQGIMVV